MYSLVCEPSLLTPTTTTPFLRYANWFVPLSPLSDAHLALFLREELSRFAANTLSFSLYASLVLQFAFEASRAGERRLLLAVLSEMRDVVMKEKESARWQKYGQLLEFLFKELLYLQEESSQEYVKESSLECVKESSLECVKESSQEYVKESSQERMEGKEEISQECMGETSQDDLQTNWESIQAFLEVLLLVPSTQIAPMLQVVFTKVLPLMQNLPVAKAQEEDLLFGWGETAAEEKTANCGIPEDVQKAMHASLNALAKKLVEVCDVAHLNLLLTQLNETPSVEECTRKEVLAALTKKMTAEAKLSLKRGLSECERAR